MSLKQNLIKYFVDKLATLVLLVVFLQLLYVGMTSILSINTWFAVGFIVVLFVAGLWFLKIIERWFMNWKVPHMNLKEHRTYFLSQTFFQFFIIFLIFGALTRVGMDSAYVLTIILIAVIGFKQIKNWKEIKKSFVVEADDLE